MQPSRAIRRHAAAPWSPDSWKSRLAAHQVVYDDASQVERAVQTLRGLPPLVTSWEVERLKELLAEAERGERFLLQGGDCAETLDGCRSDVITRMLKILLQMSLVLVHASKRPVIRVGRLAGQYAKPRSKATETRSVDGEDVTLPVYRGDLVNREPFDAASRRPDPGLMVESYQHAAMTLNFVRSLMDCGFADLHHTEYWDLGFLTRANLPGAVREDYERITASVADGLRFAEAIGEREIHELHGGEFFTSHEGLNLLYESAQTRTVPRREGHYDLTTHLPWIGDRTRQPDGAHVEYFRGIENPVGVKLGPSITADELLVLLAALNPADEAGKVVLIGRFGADHVREALPPLVEAVARAGRRALWVCDPMHGNTTVTAGGVKTRHFDRVLAELEAAWDVLEECGGRLGGVHIELTGDDVTECVGGASGIREADLGRNYASLCDPRLNYEQSLELAFLLARHMARA